MTGVDIDLEDADFDINRSRFAKLQNTVMELPSRLRLAAQGAWRGKERGLAVITGVFLSSLVITTVLAYGVGYSDLDLLHVASYYQFVGPKFSYRHAHWCSEN